MPQAGQRGGQSRSGIIIKRSEDAGHAAHHGGAWKIAYADFVTAMMAFFLLMWLINATSQEQRRGLADYFSKSNILGRAMSGSGKPFGGQTPHDVGAMLSTQGSPVVITGIRPQAPDTEEEEEEGVAPARQQDPGPREQAQAQAQAQLGLRLRPSLKPNDGPADYAQGGDYAEPRLQPPPPSPPPPDPAVEAARAATQRETAALERVAEQVRAAVRDDPVLKELASQVAVDQTPEGLRIQLLDGERRPMFALGSAALGEHTRLLFQKVAPTLLQVPNPISIAGHTDSAPFRGVGKTNWELSSERAHAARRLLNEAGLPDSRIRSVSGNADRDLLVPEDPLAAGNRRIAIILLRTEPGAGNPDLTSREKAAAR